MSRYAIEERVLRDTNLLLEDLMTQAEAARILGISVQAVNQQLSRGRFTVVIDTEARNPYRERRFVLRSEVEARLMEST